MRFMKEKMSKLIANCQAVPAAELSSSANQKTLNEACAILSKFSGLGDILCMCCIFQCYPFNGKFVNRNKMRLNAHQIAFVASYIANGFLSK